VRIVNSALKIQCYVEKTHSYGLLFWRLYPLGKLTLTFKEDKENSNPLEKKYNIVTWTWTIFSILDFIEDKMIYRDVKFMPASDIYARGFWFKENVTLLAGHKCHLCPQKRR